MVYYDANANCVFDSNDVAQGNVKVQLYNNGVLEQQTYTGGAGYYSFYVNGVYGNYTAQIDTTQLPFTVLCPDTAYYTSIVSASDSQYANQNYGLSCKQGFDVGAISILNGNTVPRPASIVRVNIVPGISQLYGAHCATGISGQVQVVYSGQISYQGIAPGAITPTSVQGDTITWAISDFGTISDDSAFNLMFKINTNATPGSQVCFVVNVLPVAGDNNPSNNTLSYCFAIVNALDPNEKEVYPASVDTSGWLTYTIRFQNTGTAPAENIYILDTLDSHLDPGTFHLINYSADNITQILPGSIARFYFPEINLPDSLTSDSLSRGYVSYQNKIKERCCTRNKHQ